MYIPLLIAGMIALFGGRFVITETFQLKGDRARIFGGLLMAPWIIAAASGVSIGGANPMFGDLPTVSANGLTGTIVFWGCVLAALLYGFAMRQQQMNADADADADAPASQNKTHSGSKSPRARKAA